MLRNVFTRTLWDARRSLPTWIMAVCAVGAMYGGTWSMIKSPQMQQAMESYPKGMLEAMSYTDLGTATGYVGGTVYGLLTPLLMIIFAISWGTRAVAGDEEAGTLDLLLAHPVSRTRAGLQRFAALAAAIAVIGVALWLVMIAIAMPSQLDGITIVEFAAATAELALFATCFGALAFAIGAATGSKALALGGSAGVGVLTYLANGVFPQVDGLEWTRHVSLWHWYLGGEPLRNGLQVSDSLLLLATALLLVAIGTWAFNHRDVAV